MAGPLQQLIKGSQDKKAAKKNRQFAAEQQRAGMQLINELDYEPMYASQNVPTFQRSQSPVARSYLESFLAGNNPDATFSGSPNAKLVKQRQQQSQNAMFGTMDERIAKQRAMEAATPWKVTTPTRQVNPNRSADAGAAQWTAENSSLAGLGVNKNLASALADTGDDVKTLYDTSQNSKAGGNALQAGIDMAAMKGELDRLLKVYNNDPNKLADAIRAAGGIDNLSKQHSGKKR